MYIYSEEMWIQLVYVCTVWLKCGRFICYSRCCEIIHPSVYPSSSTYLIQGRGGAGVYPSSHRAVKCILEKLPRKEVVGIVKGNAVQTVVSMNPISRSFVFIFLFSNHSTVLSSAQMYNCTIREPRNIEETHYSRALGLRLPYVVFFLFFFDICFHCCFVSQALVPRSEAGRRRTTSFCFISSRGQESGERCPNRLVPTSGMNGSLTRVMS